MGTDRIEMNAYQDTIAAVRKLLQDNPEWIARYKGYIDTFAEKKAAGTFSRAQRQFAVPAPFQLYLSLSMAIHKCTAKRTAFELRFHGQSVATVFVDNQKEKYQPFIKCSVKNWKRMLRIWTAWIYRLHTPGTERKLKISEEFTPTWSVQ